MLEGDLSSLIASSTAFSLSTDGWSTQDVSYLGIVANVMMAGQHPVRLLIGFEPYDSSINNGADQTSALLDTAVITHPNLSRPRQYGLPHVLIADSCATNIAAFTNHSSFLKHGVLIPCSKHLLHNSVNAAIQFVPCLPELLCRVRSASALIRNHSSFRMLC